VAFKKKTAGGEGTLPAFLLLALGTPPTKKERNRPTTSGSSAPGWVPNWKNHVRKRNWPTLVEGKGKHEKSWGDNNERGQKILKDNPEKRAGHGKTNVISPSVR